MRRKFALPLSRGLVGVITGHLLFLLACGEGMRLINYLQKISLPSLPAELMMNSEGRIFAFHSCNDGATNNRRLDHHYSLIGCDDEITPPIRC